MAVRRGDPCTIDDCGKPVVGRGWCSMHYARWRTYGDPQHQTRPYVPQAETCAVEDCGRPTGSHGFCTMHVRRSRLHGETTDPRERRFWAQVDRNGPVPDFAPHLGPCWLWTGYVHKATGYGLFGVRAGTRLVHRIAYQYVVGPIPKGLHLDHLCRVRTCICPDHLEPVTPQENIRRGDQGAFWGYVPDVVPVRPKAEKPTTCTESGCERPVAKRTLCRPCYRKWLKDPNVVRPAPLTAEQRFWAKVEKTDSCWLWTASINPRTGYGRFGVHHGKMVDAHRYSYLLAHGAIPDGFDVHHTCHVRHCVAPDHLQALSRSDNLRLRKVRR